MFKNHNIASSALAKLPFFISSIRSKSVLGYGIVAGHSPFGAGVTVTIVEASNVGVKVGMVGRGVIDAVGVALGIEVFVLVGIGDGVIVAF